MARYRTLLVAARRRQPWDSTDPSSRIVLHSMGRMHPANEAYNMPAGEVCICEGQGVQGDPGGQHEPWEVYPYPEVTKAIADGRLVEVERGAPTNDLVVTDADLASLELSDRAREGLAARRVEGVEDLADKLASVADPVDWLTKTNGIGKATARDLLEQLEARGLLEVV